MKRSVSSGSRPRGHGESISSPGGDHTQKFLTRNDNNRTPLAEAIVSKDDSAVEEYLLDGAACSIFVKGYKPGSIVCTLPQARQPPSSVVSHPPPFEDSSPEVISNVDEALASYVDSLVRAAASQKIDKALHSKDQTSSPADPANPADPGTGANASSAAATAGAPAPAAAAANNLTTLPAVLTAGDRVKRGTTWTSSGHTSEDANGEGEVIQVQASMSYVRWDNGNPYHAIYYDPPNGVTDVQLVTPTAVPVGPEEPDEFKAGDLVLLTSYEDKAEKAGANEKKELKKKTFTTGILVKQIIDDPKDGKKKSKKGHKHANANAANTNSSKESIEPNWLFASLANGFEKHASQRNLTYADGSYRGKAFPVPIQRVSGGVNGHDMQSLTSFHCISCSMRGPSSQTSATGCVTCKICAVCASKNLRGQCKGVKGAVVKSTHTMQTPYYSSGFGGSSASKCQNCHNHLNSSNCGYLQCGTCKFCSVCCSKIPSCGASSIGFGPTVLKGQVNITAAQMSGVFMVGDRVELDDSFSENGGNGWCLGSVGSGKVGVITHVPPQHPNNKAEQRDILVCGLDDTSVVFKFRSSWLKLSPNSGQHRFNIGDRVQLDRSTYVPGSIIVAGKCLGMPDEYRFGIVKHIGIIRDGIQRNIEVEVHEDCVSADEKTKISLYPGYALVLAVRQISLTLKDIASLQSEVERVTKWRPNKWNFNIWSNVSNITKPSIAESARIKWESARDLSWPSNDFIRPSLLLERDEILKSIKAEPMDWTCKHCAFDKNNETTTKCFSCGKKGAPWECSSCNASNKINFSRCFVCLRERTFKYAHRGIWKTMKSGGDVCQPCLDSSEKVGKAVDISVSDSAAKGPGGNSGSNSSPAKETKDSNIKVDPEPSAPAKTTAVDSPSDSVADATQPSKGAKSDDKTENPAPSTPAFSFGTSTSPATLATPAPAGAFSFSAAAPAPAAGFGFGAAAPAAAFGFAAAAPAPATGFGFGAPAPAPATGFGFGAPAPAPSGGFGFGFGAAAPAPAAGFGFGAAATSAFGLGPAYSPPSPKYSPSSPSTSPVPFSFQPAPEASETIDDEADAVELDPAVVTTNDDLSDEVDELPVEDTEDESQKEVAEVGTEVCLPCLHSRSVTGADHWTCCGSNDRDSTSCLEPGNINTKKPYDITYSIDSCRPRVDFPTKGFDSTKGEIQNFKFSDDKMTATSTSGVSFLFSDISTAKADIIEWHWKDIGSYSVFGFGFCPENKLSQHASMYTDPAYFIFDANAGVGSTYISMQKQSGTLIADTVKGTVVLKVDDGESHTWKIKDKNIRLSFISYGSGNIQLESCKAYSIPVQHIFQKGFCSVCINCNRCSGYKNCVVKHPADRSDAGRPCGCGFGPTVCSICYKCTVCIQRYKIVCDKRVRGRATLLRSMVLFGKAFTQNFDAAAKENSAAVAELSKEEEAQSESESDSDSDSDNEVEVAQTNDNSHLSDEISYNNDAFELLMRPKVVPEVEEIDVPIIDSPEDTPVLSRQMSSNYYELSSFEPISSIDEFIANVDKEGSSAAHYAAQIGLTRTLKALYLAGADRWASNKFNQTPAGIVDKVDFNSSHHVALHRICCRRELLSGPMLRAALNTPVNFRPHEELLEVEEALEDNRKKDALAWAADCVSKNISHSEIYYALALLENKFPINCALDLMKTYESKFANGSETQLTPFYFYLQYYLWKKQGASKKKCLRLRAADALSICRLFPRFANSWISDSDTVDIDALEDLPEEFNKDTGIMDPDDEESEDEADDGPNSPAAQWNMAVKSFGASSPSMDKLMKLTGLKSVKSNAVTIFKEVLLQKMRKALGLKVKAETSMNYLFVGNPGVGKTTVATLFAAIMVELGLRTNPTPILTSATEILAGSPGDFSTLCDKATNGTMFIDEAYLIKPSPKGSQPGPANAILDILLDVSEKKRETTSFILAGYKEEILELLTYNDGFKSRFPITFDFEDYSTRQLKKIFRDMISDRNYILESKKDCGVPIAKVAAARIAKGRGKKGFGNARTVRIFVDSAVRANSDRVGTLALSGVKLTARELSLITRGDVLGEKPDLEKSHLLRELNGMIGLTRVKEAVRGLMALQIQNFECESRGEPKQEISLNRLFMGNPGTGKTTVARIYGALLKEFGFLSNGDVISVTAADLMGSAVGSSSEKTVQFLKQAEGKVLFIDEAYVLDPNRSQLSTYGGDVLDTIVQKLEGSAGSDMAVILAGYTDEMEGMLRHGNAGLKRRFQPEEAIYFDDYSDEELQQILLYMADKAGLIIMPNVAKKATELISESRRIGRFGNAGTVENFLSRAKINKSKRLEEFAKAKYIAISKGQLPGREPNPREVIFEDFLNEEVSAEKGRATLEGLYNIDHIKEFIDDLEVTISAKLKEGISPGSLVSSLHMVFTGPPGTGKTTIANKLGTILKNLKVLPTDKVVKTTGNQLQGRYVGETKHKVIEKMEAALGGILFIDEAYGMIQGGFGPEVALSLVELITSEQFHGNLLVIMAGYEADMRRLFSVANEGLRSRFEKKTIEFKSWTGSHATELTVKMIEKSGKQITPDAALLMEKLYGIMSELPNWASARDVTETIYPNLYSKRAYRLSREEKAKAKGPSAADLPPAPPVSRKNGAPVEAEEVPPYTADDVQKTFEEVLSKRGGSASPSSKFESTVEVDRSFILSNRGGGMDDYNIPQSNYGPNDGMLCRPIQNQNQKQKQAEKAEEAKIDYRNAGKDKKDFWAFLEEACSELEYSPEKMKDILEHPASQFPKELLALVMEKADATEQEVIEGLEPQRPDALDRVKKLIAQLKKQKTEEDRRKQAKIRALGRCPVNFEWLRVDGGYRCAGGSHYLSDAELK